VSSEDECRWQEAARLRREHPAWLVIWLASARQYRAYRRASQARHETTLCAGTPDELVAVILQAEQATPTRRPDSKD
jgi:hypothetical protein